MRELRSQLQQRRAQGIAFDVAWTAALAIALDGLSTAKSWRDVLTGHRAVWAAAYRREPIEALDALNVLSLGSEPPSDMRRSGPPVVVYGQRHDGPCELEPLVVPWCC